MGVTVISSAGTGLLKIRSRVLPALCVGGVWLRARSKDDSSGSRHDDCSLFDGRLKSPRRMSEVLSMGKRLRRTSYSSMKLPRGEGGR